VKEENGGLKGTTEERGCKTKKYREERENGRKSDELVNEKSFYVFTR
jgi:hypothetical protein